MSTAAAARPVQAGAAAAVLEATTADDPVQVRACAAATCGLLGVHFFRAMPDVARPLTQPSAAAGRAALSARRSRSTPPNPATTQAALARLAHPSTLQLAGVVPALRSALGSLQDAPGSWERAVLASPLLQGLLSLCTDLLERPAAGALGPEAPLLVLEVLSHMPASEGAALGACRQSEHCRALWRRAHVSLGGGADAAGIWALADGAASLMTPDMLVRYYEAAGRSPFAGAPSKSCGLGLLLRAHLRSRWADDGCAAGAPRLRQVAARGARGCHHIQVAKRSRPTGVDRKGLCFIASLHGPPLPALHPTHPHHTTTTTHPHPLQALLR